MIPSNTRSGSILSALNPIKRLHSLTVKPFPIHFDGKTKELVSEALPSAYSPTVEDRVRNHQQLNSDELPITNQSLVDMLCLAYQQYRGQVSLDFIKNKANLTSAKKKKILDDFSDMLEREITQNLDK